jgi:hypothetical protein
MAITPAGSDPRQVLHPAGVGAGAIFHPRVCPNLTQVFLGVGSGSKSHSQVTRWAPKISTMTIKPACAIFHPTLSPWVRFLVHPTRTRHIAIPSGTGQASFV